MRNRLRYTALPANDPGDLALRHSVRFSDQPLPPFVGTYGCDLFVSQLRPGAFFTAKECPVKPLVPFIFDVSLPLKVGQCGVGSVSIEVGAFHSLGWFADERSDHQEVDKECPTSVVSIQPNLSVPVITVAYGERHDALLNLPDLVETGLAGSGLTPYSAQVADRVKTFVSANRQPDFIHRSS